MWDTCIFILGSHYVMFHSSMMISYSWQTAWTDKKIGSVPLFTGVTIFFSDALFEMETMESLIRCGTCCIIFNYWIILKVGSSNIILINTIYPTNNLHLIFLVWLMLYGKKGENAWRKEEWEKGREREREKKLRQRTLTVAVTLFILELPSTIATFLFPACNSFLKRWSRY